MECRKIVERDFGEIVEHLRDIDGEMALGLEQHEDYVRHHLRNLVGSPNQIGFIAPSRGFILATVIQQWYSPEVIGAEQLLYIRPGARGGSLPLRLIRSFETEAIRRGATKLMAGSSLGFKTESVAKLYERLGYSQTNIGVIKHVS